MKEQFSLFIFPHKCSHFSSKLDPADDVFGKKFIQQNVLFEKLRDFFYKMCVVTLETDWNCSKWKFFFTQSCFKTRSVSEKA